VLVTSLVAAPALGVLAAGRTPASAPATAP
jgi:hypothetical protein